MLSKITHAIRPSCSYCNTKCKHYWYERVRNESDSHKPKKTEPNALLCADCYFKKTVPEAENETNYKEVFIVDEICRKDKIDKIDEKIKLLESFEECHLDLQKIMQKFPDRTAFEIIKQFLLIPIKNFKGILKLTNQHFENIFKKDYSVKTHDVQSDNLVYQLSFLKLMFEKSEDVNFKNSVVSQTTSSNIKNESLSFFVCQNQARINGLKNEIKTRAHYLLKKVI